MTRRVTFAHDSTTISVSIDGSFHIVPSEGSWLPFDILPPQQMSPLPRNTVSLTSNMVSQVWYAHHPPETR
jgi:hypothetical protein